MKEFAYIAAVALVCTVVQPARAGGDTKPLEERMARLEQALTDLQTAWRQQGVDMARDSTSVEQILKDWNEFQGKVDAMSQQQQLLFDQFRKYIDEFEARLLRVEQKMALGTVEEDTAAEATAVLPVEGLPTGPAKEKTALYQDALNTVRDRRYAEAANLFRNFLQQAPQHELADRAQFWVGECHYAMGNYQPAIDAYNVLLTTFPNSSKTAVALFRKANAYAELGKIHEAQQTFRDLIAKAPNSKEAKHAASQLQAIANATAERSAP